MDAKLSIKYREGYKYQLAETAIAQTVIRPPEEISNRFIRLTPDGILTVREDYAWDGPSGLTIDTKTSMAASLVHDALYQLLREGLLAPAWRRAADAELERFGIGGGMFPLRARLWYDAVRVGAGPAADPRNDKRVVTAP